MERSKWREINSLAFLGSSKTTPGEWVQTTKKTPKQTVVAHVSMYTYMCHKRGGGWGRGAASRNSPPKINIKPDDVPTHSIGSDVKRDKNVPNSISAPSSESYQRASSVSTQQPPPLRATHAHTPNTSHCSIFALHRNQGCVAVSRRQVYLKRKHLIFFFLAPLIPRLPC